MLETPRLAGTQLGGVPVNDPVGIVYPDGIVPRTNILEQENTTPWKSRGREDGGPMCAYKKLGKVERRLAGGNQDKFEGLEGLQGQPSEIDWARISWGD